MAGSKKLELEQELKNNKIKITDSKRTIEDQIVQNGIAKGKVAFFDENGDRIRSKQDFGNSNNNGRNELLFVPLQTKRIVANCDLDLTGVERTGPLHIYAAGNVTGENVAIREAIVHATGYVNLASNPDKHTKNYITVVSGGDTTLNGYVGVTANSGGSILSDKNSLFLHAAAEKDVDIGILAEKTMTAGHKAYAGGKAKVDILLKGAEMLECGKSPNPETMADKIARKRISRYGVGAGASVFIG